MGLMKVDHVFHESVICAGQTDQIRVPTCIVFEDQGPLLKGQHIHSYWRTDTAKENQHEILPKQKIFTSEMWSESHFVVNPRDKQE